MQKLEDVYHKSRPTLRVEPGKVLELDDHVGLHPSLKDLHRLGRPVSSRSCRVLSIRTRIARIFGRWRSGRPEPSALRRRPAGGWLAGAAWRCTPPAGALPCRAGVDAAGRAGAEGGGPVAGQRRRVLPRQEGSSQTGNHGTTPPYGRELPPGRTWKGEVDSDSLFRVFRWIPWLISDFRDLYASLIRGRTITTTRGARRESRSAQFSRRV